MLLFHAVFASGVWKTITPVEMSNGANTKESS